MDKSHEFTFLEAIKSVIVLNEILNVRLNDHTHAVPFQALLAPLHLQLRDVEL